MVPYIWYRIYGTIYMELYIWYHIYGTVYTVPYIWYHIYGTMDISMDMHRPAKISIHAVFNYAVSIINSNGNYQMYDHVLPSSFCMFFVVFPERNSKCMTTYCLIVAGSSVQRYTHFDRQDRQDPMLHHPELHIHIILCMRTHITYIICAA